MIRRSLSKMASALGACEMVGAFNAALLTAAEVEASGNQSRKAPFSNDTTKTLSCVSPHHKRGEGTLTAEMIQASVDEAFVSAGNRRRWAKRVDHHFRAGRSDDGRVFGSGAEGATR